MKKIILTAAISAVLLFALAATTAGGPTSRDQPPGAKVRCVGCVFGHYVLTPVW